MTSPANAPKIDEAAEQQLADHLVTAVAKIPGVRDVEVLSLDPAGVILGFTHRGVPHSLSWNVTP